MTNTRDIIASGGEKFKYTKGDGGRALEQRLYEAANPLKVGATTNFPAVIVGAATHGVQLRVCTINRQTHAHTRTHTHTHTTTIPCP